VNPYLPWSGKVTPRDYRPGGGPSPAGDDRCGPIGAGDGRNRVVHGVWTGEWWTGLALEGVAVCEGCSGRVNLLAVTFNRASYFSFSTGQ